MAPLSTPDRAERGGTLIELMIALVVLSLGILAIGSVFPAGSRGQLRDRMMTRASFYAQEKLEHLQSASWFDTSLTVGTHFPGGEPLGDAGQWRREYLVEQLAAPLDNLKKVTVTVSWTFPNDRSVTAVTYYRR